MATIANLIIKVSAQTKGIQAALAKTTSKIKSFAKSAIKTLAGIGGALGIGNLTTFAGLSLIINKTSAEIDKLAKTSSKLGLTTEALQKLQYQGELSGVSADTLSTAMQRMVRRIAEAAVGTGEAKAAIAELGLDAQQLARLSPDRQFYAIADAMRNIGLRGDQVRLAMKVFDTEGVGLVNTFNSNLQQAGQEFDALGIGITQSQAAMVEAFNDSKARLAAIFSGFGIQLTTQLAEPFTKLISYISNVIIEMGGMKGVANAFARFMLNGIIATVKGVKSLISVIGDLKNVMLEAEKLKLFLTQPLPFTGKGQERQENQNKRLAIDAQIQKNNATGGSGAIVSGLESLVKELETYNPGGDTGKAASTALAAKVRADTNAATKTNELATAAGNAAKAITPKSSTSQSKTKQFYSTQGFNDISSRFAATGLSASLENGGLFGSQGSRSTGISGQGASSGGKVLSMQEYINRSPGGKALQDLRKGTFGTSTGAGNTGFVNGNFVNAEKFAGDTQTIGGKAVSDILGQGKPKTTITLNMVTEAGKISGTIFGDQDFIDKIDNVSKKQTNKSATMVGI